MGSPSREVDLSGCRSPDVPITRFPRGIRLRNILDSLRPSKSCNIHKQPVMAAFGWQREKSVEEWLFSEAYRFDFFQAVRLLELIFPDCTPVGEGPEPEKEAVRFSARVGFDFPAGEVHDLLPSGDGSPPSMVTNFLGLAGATGP